MDDNPPEPGKSLDLDALNLGHMVKHARTATFAPNWLSVLAADAFVGLLIIVVGALVRSWIAIVGWLIVAVGIVYVLLVGRRFLQWRWLRRQAGLR